MSHSFIWIALVVLLTLLFLAYRIYVHNNRLTVTRYSLRSPRITEPVQIVQLSDLHNKQFGKDNHDLFDTILRQRPDVVVVTGDLEDRREPYEPATTLFLKRLAEKVPVYFVYGNQEMRGNFKEILTADLRDFGVHVLDGQAATLVANGQTVQILGLNDYREKQKMPRDRHAQLLRQFSKSDGFRLLLTHYPHYFSRYSSYHYSDYQIDLVLAGHAHGGLIRLPFIKGVIAPDQGLFPRYTAGPYRHKDAVMIVSRGLGNSGWPFRINNPPEVVVITLLPPI